MEKDFIFGIRAIIEAIEAGKNIDKIIIKSGLKGELYSELFIKIKEHHVPFQYVPIEKVNKITRKNHQGVVAFLSQVEYQNYENIVSACYDNGKQPLVLVLDKITDVRNFGAIARSAECAGVDAIIIPSVGNAPVNADAVKTSAGALHHIPVCKVGNLSKTIKSLKNYGLQIVAASEKKDMLYYSVDFTKPTAIIMGAEDTGISDELLRQSDEIVKIPITGTIQSLNVSVAAALFIFEAVRQRNLS